jgi:4'-phosphopantetheinyl transferase
MTSTPTGQPQWPGTPWATSLSHSGSWVALAVGCTAVLGVDIERSPPLRALNDLVSTICTPREAIDMQELPPAAREHAMLRLWTRKEALLKAFGTGLSGPPPATFAALPDACVAPPPGPDCPPCRVHELQLPTAVVGALAVPDGAGTRRLHILDGPVAEEGRAG